MKRIAIACLLLAGCQSDPPISPPSVVAAEARAAQHQAAASRANRAADTLRTQGQTAEDSANHYQKQSHAPTSAPTDSTSLVRFFADFFSRR